MAFSYGLGTNNMQNQFNQDTSVFKIQDIAKNIQKYDSASLPTSAYVDYTPKHLNRFMQRDQENDNSATFLFEYQALLRSRMQQMITELTAALTRDLDQALVQERADWGVGRTGAQGYSSDLEDAGAARVAYNFLTGFSQGVNPAGGAIDSVPYTGVPTWDQYRGTYINKVSPDTSADAQFFSSRGAALRSVGTATIQQTFPEDNLDEAVIDELFIVHGQQNVRYQEIGGGFVAHENRYRFTDVENAARDDAQNIGFLNATLADTVAGTTEGGNLNDNDWDAGVPAIAYQLFNRSGNVKNEFERVLYDTIFELDQRNLLRDVFRLSEKDGFFTDIQIASTSSLVNGSQAQASIFLNFRPFFDGVTADDTDTDGDGDLTESRAFRPDLGGNIDVIMDRFTAFYHS